MSVGLLFDSDDYVAQWLFQKNSQPPLTYDGCLGLVDASGSLVGAILFHNWNGFNIELSYYGANTLSVGLVRCVFRYMLLQYNPARLTVTTSKKRRALMKSIQRFGFALEGHQRCYYGQRDCNRNTGIRFVMFRAKIEKIARSPTAQKAA